MLSSQRTRARSRLGTAALRAKRDPSPEADEKVVEARRDYAAASIEDYVRTVVDAAPPLTATQKARLAALFAGGSDVA